MPVKSDKSHRNILVTGGSGFIGKNIVESFLASKYNIIAPTHKDLDLMDEHKVRDFFKENNIDIVIHSACKPGHRNAKDPTNILYSNTRMFFNLVHNSTLYKKMIVMGSGAVYDMRYYRPKMKEDYFGFHVPVDEHGFGRYVCARFIELVDNIIELRIFGIFGKYEDYAIRFISNAICKVIFDLPVTIKQNRNFDYLYINDLMPVLEHFIENKPAYKVYNVTPDCSIDLYSLARKVINISGKDLPVIVSQMGTGLDYSGDNTLLHKEIKNLKFTAIDEAIKELYKWYSNNKHLIDRNVLLFDK